MKITIEQSNAFYKLKAIAVFTIFFAHMPILFGGCNLMFKYIGMTGVPIFLIMAGYFESGSRSSLIQKAKSLFIPLLIWGTLSFIRVTLGFKSYESVCVLAWAKWVYGAGTWLYFVPVLFWCKILNLYDKLGFQLILLLISILSIGLTSIGCIPYTENITKYMNPFNFLIYFQMGYWVRKCEFDFTSKLCLIGALSLLVLVLLGWHTTPTYFNLWCIPYSITTFILLYQVAAHIGYGIVIGKISFVIYLSHLIFTGVIERRLLSFLRNTPVEF